MEKTEFGFVKFDYLRLQMGLRIQKGEMVVHCQAGEP
jgi:hypothetical protein